MNVWLDIILALLAAVGLLALGWVLFGRLLAPWGGKGGTIYTVLPAAGDGDTLEHDMIALLWLQGGSGAPFTIIIADGGLTPAGRAVATALLARSPGVLVCPLEQLSQHLVPAATLITKPQER